MSGNDYFTFNSGQATDVGLRRQVNEDSFLSRPESGLWVVADGMGGHAAGDFASQTIVRELFSVGMASSGEDLQARFMERLIRANDLILDHAEELGGGTIGATLVALLVHDDNYACIWSGDSRIYLLRSGQLVQQTRDHTELQALLDAGAISQEDAADWPRKNVITRAVGVTAEPECDVVGGTLVRGDMFLLCSDGLTEHVLDHEISHMMATMEPQDACESLINLTLERGAKDNVTVVTVRFDAPAPEALAAFDLKMDDLS